MRFSGTPPAPAPFDTLRTGSAPLANPPGFGHAFVIQDAIVPHGQLTDASVRGRRETSILGVRRCYMRKIVITDIDSAPWVRESMLNGRKTGAQLVGEEDEGLRAFIQNREPGFQTEVHSHSQDEVIYIVDGEIRMGKRVLGPGSILLIPKDVQYQFTAGDDGVRFLNIRPGPSDYQPVGKPVVPSGSMYGKKSGS